MLTRAGAAAQQLGDRPRALAYYERANAIQPRAETFSNLGTIHFGLGDFAKAAAAYEGSLLIRPVSATTNRTWATPMRASAVALTRGEHINKR